MTRFARAHLCAATSALLLLLAGCSSAPASNAQTQLCGISDASGWESATSQTPAKRAISQAASEIGGEAKFATGEGELDALLKGGCTIVVSEGQGMTQAITQAAKKNSSVRFITVNSGFESANKTVEPSNGKAVVSRATQGAYMAGYASAGLTTTGTIAGFGGVETSAGS